MYALSLLNGEVLHSELIDCYAGACKPLGTLQEYCGYGAIDKFPCFICVLVFIILNIVKFT